MSNLDHGIYKTFLKRPLDIIVSLTAILVLMPVLFLVAFLVRFNLGNPVFFKQTRPGLNETYFKMYKFRTMTDDRDANGELLPDSVRLTNFGKFLRSTSLDELPELFNILKGDMSIVGPRPQLVRDMWFMTPHQRQRHNVFPGLTGLAQISGRNHVTWEDKLSLDVLYLSNITFLGDLKIILKTFVKVFCRDGVNAVGMNTAEDLGDYLLRVGKIDEAAYHKVIDKSKYI